jgi:hypothetical protein
MFGRKRRLLRDGAQARALVTEAKIIGQSDIGAGSPTGYAKVKLKVQFDDGTTSEIARWVNFARVGRRVSEGVILPVRYDPEDRTKIVIDSRSIKRGREAARADMKKRAVARGEQELAQESSTTARATPVRNPTFAQIKAMGEAERAAAAEDDGGGR